MSTVGPSTPPVSTEPISTAPSGPTSTEDPTVPVPPTVTAGSCSSASAVQRLAAATDQLRADWDASLETVAVHVKGGLVTTTTAGVLRGIEVTMADDRAQVDRARTELMSAFDACGNACSLTRSALAPYLAASDAVANASRTGASDKGAGDEAVVQAWGEALTRARTSLATLSATPVPRVTC